MTNATSGGLPISAAHLQTPPIHIPDGSGGAYKTELVLFRDPTTRTEKVIWWHADDPRPDPHNHPWGFTSSILAGGYTEERYDVSGHLFETHIYRAGDINSVAANDFHRVVDVQPGTVTHLVCGPAAEGNAWGYRAKDTGDYYPFQDPLAGTSTFLDEMRAINPHMARPSDNANSGLELEQATSQYVDNHERAVRAYGDGLSEFIAWLRDEMAKNCDDWMLNTSIKNTEGVDSLDRQMNTYQRILGQAEQIRNRYNAHSEVRTNDA